MDILLRREGTFIPKLLEAVEPEPGRQRTNPFPQNQQELTIATAWRFVEEGQDVLVFCTERRSVEPYAKKAIQLYSQGLIEPLIDDDTIAKLARVERIGREWLGDSHPAVKCLRLGVAVHHGGLPNPYLREVEAALREGLLKVTIASPTLAQGLNLSAAILLVPSIYRFGEPISPEEFANVAGRAGRAYVDIDGVILNVLFQPTRRKINQWVGLIRAAAERNVESGLFKLVLLIAERLISKGALSEANAYEYLVNTPAAWVDPVVEADEDEDQEGEPLEDLVARLDAALLALIDPLDCPVEELPARLDEALTSSLWARRLARLDQAGQDLQQLVLQARSERIWTETQPVQRRGYFNAGLGFRTGQFLDENAAALGEHLRAADEAALPGLPEQMAEALVAFAEVVFSVKPFTPRMDLPDEWRDIVARWMSGEAANNLVERFGSDVITFIEDALCYRLVWAMEAVRVRALAHGTYDPVMPGAAAICVETGMPNTRAASLVRSGLPSRTAGLKATEDGAAEFVDHAEMLAWLRSDRIRALSAEEDWPSEQTHTLWVDFLGRLAAGREQAWDEGVFEVPVEWFGEARPDPELVRTMRVVENEETETQDVCTADLTPIGVLAAHIPGLIGSLVTVSGMTDDGGLRVRRIGPPIP